jgi:hypothetical protein
MTKTLPPNFKRPKKPIITFSSDREKNFLVTTVVVDDERHKEHMKKLERSMNTEMYFGESDFF